MAIDKDTELKRLRWARDRRDGAEKEIRRQLSRLRQAGVSLRELGDAVGLSDSQVSRITNPPPAGEQS